MKNLFTPVKNHISRNKIFTPQSKNRLFSTQKMKRKPFTAEIKSFRGKSLFEFENQDNPLKYRKRSKYFNFRKIKYF